MHNLIDNSKTDKNTTHSYLPTYQKIFANKKETAKHILEIGIGDNSCSSGNGGSIKLWHDYFQNATIHALDIISLDIIWDQIKNNNRISIYHSSDAYEETFFNDNFLNKDIKFDIMIDDGPHSLNSMMTFIKLYSKLLTNNGILVIEDIQSIDWIPILMNQVPDNLKKFIQVYDLRSIKNRYDDLLFVINTGIVLDIPRID